MRAFYSVAELARIGGVPTYRLLRLLWCNGVTFMPMGRAFYVTLVEIRQVTVHGRRSVVGPFRTV